MQEWMKKGKGPSSGRRRPSRKLVLLFAGLFSAPLASQSFLNALFFARLQVEGMTLHFFDDVFLLHLAFETSKRVFEGFALLNTDFSQNELHPPTSPKEDPIVIARLRVPSQGECKVLFPVTMGKERLVIRRSIAKRVEFDVERTR